MKDELGLMQDKPDHLQETEKHQRQTWTTHKRHATERRRQKVIAHVELLICYNCILDLDERGSLQRKNMNGNGYWERSNKEILPRSRMK